MSVRERPATRAWREALDQMDRLLQQAPPERDASLGALADSRPDLHPLVISLLDAEARASSSSFLDPPPAASGAAVQAGVQLGPYRILSQIGSGGMGEVWLARRDDGLYDGEVAIKTLHPYFAGGALRERFLHEARLLGRLTHANIARLLDAGISAGGNVYLVLEYVHGVAIDAWCDERLLGVAARLRLFMEVCAAVAHAHSNLIVHRDIKPSNILVTDDGRVKLLDFGVAKLVEADAHGGSSDLTRLTGRMFTPEYAAPEQILGQSITTATDVYALGVLLHVLLSGTRPYGASSNSVEVERAVIHDEPVPASRFVASVDAERIASARSTTPQRLKRELAGDVDNIIWRALHKDPAERYGSVLALHDDLQRHLANQPILAQPESAGARARKFVRRHRAAAIAAALVIAAVTTGLVGVVWQAQVARNEARKATAIRDFLVGIFERNSIAHPDGARARETTAAELLAQSAKEIRGTLHDAPEVRTELLGVMSQLYASLDMQSDAIALLTDKLASQRAAHGAASIEVARTLSDLAYSYIQIGDYPAAERSANEALQIFAKLGDTTTLEHGIAYANLAQAAYRQGKTSDGSMRRNFEAALQIISAHHPQSRWHVEMYLSLSRVANIESAHEEALSNARKALALIETKTVQADGMILGAVHQTIGNGSHWLNRHADAEEHMRKALLAYEQAGGPEHPFAIDGKRELGVFLTWTGKRDEAKRLLGEALASQERAKGSDDPELTTYARMDYGNVLLLRGELEAAEPHLQRAVAIWRTAGAPINRLQLYLARLHMEQGLVDQAASDLENAEEGAIKTWGDHSWSHGTALVRVADLRFAQGRLAEAQELYARLWDEWPEEHLTTNRAHAKTGTIRGQLAEKDYLGAARTARELIGQIEASHGRPDMPDEEAAAHMLLGIALLNTNDAAGARPHLERAVTMRESMDAPESPRLAQARLHLAQALHRTGDRAAARTLLDLASEAHRAHARLAPQHHSLLTQTRTLLRS
jgi:serine/threonine protein kinase/tetratricopeptide (TPR) repeat protein